MPRNKSLRASLQTRLVWPILFFIVCESVLSYYVTLHYVNKTYDRWLLDSAKSLAQEIKASQADVLVELPKAALEIFRWDEQDKTYFKISSINKGVLAGDLEIPEPDKASDFSKPVFFNSKINNMPVRVVSMRIKRPDLLDTFYIHVAETIEKRRTMMVDILLADLVPQLFMICLAIALLFTGLNKGLRPLNTLADEIAKRSPRDLSPIPDNHVLTEVKTLTDTINGLFARLSEAIAGQQRFVANAAHQLRTPLAGFSVQVERALREHDMAAIKPALIQMQSSADRLSHTVNQLLVLAKSEPKDGTIELRPVDLCHVIKKTCMEWVPNALRRRIELGFDSAVDSILVPGEETLLREMLANLLDNAITYGKEHGHVLVSLSAGPKPTITIADDGPGICEPEVNKIFERFYRIPGSAGDGSGLGLAIVKEIADLHKIHVEFRQNDSNRGVCVMLTFPTVS